MEEEIKNDLSSIAFSHPFFSDIVGNTLNYIERLEKERDYYKQRYLEFNNLFLKTKKGDK